jgi:hypothetical protein
MTEDSFERKLRAHAPHLWVPYGIGDAEICTLCGDWLTPQTAEAECPETLTDDLPPVPAELPALEAAEGADDELRQGAVKPQP